MKRGILALLGLLIVASLSPAQTRLGSASVRGNATQEMQAPGLTARHPAFPLGSRIKVTNDATGREVEVTITGRIPASADRIIDLSPAAAQALDLGAGGVVLIAVAASPPAPPAVIAEPEPEPEPEPVVVAVPPPPPEPVVTAPPPAPEPAPVAAEPERIYVHVYVAAEPERIYVPVRVYVAAEPERIYVPVYIYVAAEPAPEPERIYVYVAAEPERIYVPVRVYVAAEPEPAPVVAAPPAEQPPVNIVVHTHLAIPETFLQGLEEVISRREGPVSRNDQRDVWREREGPINRNEQNVIINVFDPASASPVTVGGAPAAVPAWQPPLVTGMLGNVSPFQTYERTFNNPDEANAIFQILRNSGFNPLREQGGGTDRIYVAAQANSMSVSRLREMGFQETDASPFLELGRFFSSAEESYQTFRLLRNAGFNPIQERFGEEFWVYTAIGGDTVAAMRLEELDFQQLVSR